MSRAPAHDIANTFSAWVEFGPVLEKGSRDVPVAEGATRGRVRGFASVEIVDLDGETIIQKGMLLAPGTPVTLEHPRGVLNPIGEVIAVRQIEKGGRPATEVDADLYLTDELGAKVFWKSVALHKAEASYQLGFSVEGEADERDPGDKARIVKSTVHSLAVTMAPRNPDAKFSPVFAKGSFIPVFGLHKSTIGYPTQAVAHSGGLDALAYQTANTNMGGATDDPIGAPDSDLLRVMKGYDLSALDLATAYAAKRQPALSWGEVNGVVREHLESNGGLV